MKTIRALNNPTPGLAEYLDAVGDNANWNEFRSHNSGASYRELRDALTQNQHGLCAYCEIELKEWRQVEHVIPQSGDRTKSLDIANMVVCCMGGTVPGTDENYYRKPVPPNMSCDRAKGNRIDENFIDPRTLPALPSLMRVIDNGLIEVDENACRTAGFLPDHVTRTIEILNLNAERLRLAREKRWNGLEEELGQIDDPDTMDTWVHSMLMPNEADLLDPFFTTSRCYFGPLGERVLARQPQTWI